MYTFKVQDLNYKKLVYIHFFTLLVFRKLCLKEVIAQSYKSKR